MSEKVPRNRTCPICKEVIIGYSALSREDNKTKICANCGTKEALQAFITYSKNEKKGAEK